MWSSFGENLGSFGETTLGLISQARRLRDQALAINYDITTLGLISQLRNVEQLW
jgi:hypothetical protein